MSLSPEQLAQRREGITATDVAAIVGCHPFRTPLDIFLEKTGQTEPFEGNVRSRWGELLEPMIRADYEEAHHVRVEQVGTLVHPDHPWWMATPDGIVYRLRSSVPERGLEIKVHSRDAVIFGGLEYGAPGTDEVPLHELIQCAWGMGASQLDRWDLAAFLDGAPQEYAIDRDDDLLLMLSECADKFRTDHLLTGEPPEPDGSKSWENWLRRRWDKHTADLVVIDAEPDLMGIVANLRTARANAAAQVDIAKVLVQNLKLAIGGSQGLTWTDPDRKKPDKITWKRSKSSIKQDWRALTTELREVAALARSGTAEQVDRLLTCLRSIGGGTVGQSTRATISGADAAATIEAMRDALLAIVKTPIDKYETPIPGARPFVVPRHWKTIETEDKE